MGKKCYGQDFVMKLDGNVFTDSSAALGIVNRTGLGRMKHLHTQSLWVQDAQTTQRLEYVKVKGEQVPAAPEMEGGLASISTQVHAPWAFSAAGVSPRRLEQPRASEMPALVTRVAMRD